MSMHATPSSRIVQRQAQPSGAALGIVGPGPRQVQLPVDQGVPRLARLHQVDRDLGVLDPPGSPGVLTLHPNGSGALLQVAGLVHH